MKWEIEQINNSIMAIKYKTITHLKVGTFLLEVISQKYNIVFVFNGRIIIHIFFLTSLNKILMGLVIFDIFKGRSYMQNLNSLLTLLNYNVDVYWMSFKHFFINTIISQIVFNLYKFINNNCDFCDLIAFGKQPI